MADDIVLLIRTLLDVAQAVNAAGYPARRVLELQDQRGGSLTEEDLDQLRAEVEASRAARDAAIELAKKEE